MLSEKLGPEWKPDRAKFALMVTATNHLAACIDPGFPSAWRQPPYYQTLLRWARERAENPSSSWPGVDVWIGKRCIIILPDGEKDVGIVAADEEVRIDRTMTAAGAVYVATKFTVRDTAATTIHAAMKADKLVMDGRRDGAGGWRAIVRRVSDLLAPASGAPH